MRLLYSAHTDGIEITRPDRTKMRRSIVIGRVIKSMGGVETFGHGYRVIIVFFFLCPLL